MVVVSACVRAGVCVLVCRVYGKITGSNKNPIASSSTPLPLAPCPRRLDGAAGETRARARSSAKLTHHAKANFGVGLVGLVFVPLEARFQHKRRRKRPNVTRRVGGQEDVNNVANREPKR